MDETQIGTYEFGLLVDDGFVSEPVVFNFTLQIQEKEVIETVTGNGTENGSGNCTDDCTSISHSSNVSIFTGFIIPPDSESESQEVAVQLATPFRASYYRSSYLGIIEIKFNTKLMPIEDINSINETKLKLTL